MAREPIQGIYDHDSPETRRALMSRIGASRGPWEWNVTPHRPTRSLRQNADYHACIVKPLFDRLVEMGWDVTSPADAHELLAGHFLPAPSPAGEVMRSKLRRSTAGLTR